jgi:hypothetical protein
MFSHQLVLFEVKISDKEREPESDGSRGYFRMWEECGNLAKRLIKPKNIF